MKRAVIYKRVSSSEQIKGYSLDSQEEKAKHFIKANDYKLLKVYEDGGRSGENIERESLEEMINDARNNKFDVIVVYKVDRLSRSLKDFINLIDELKELGIELRSVTEPFDTSTPFGKFVIQMLASFAEFEHGLIKERSYVGILSSMQKGNWYGGAPYGYKYQNKKLDINKKEAEVVKRIYNIYSDLKPGERISLKDLQSIVNSWNIPTRMAGKVRKNCSEKFWNISTLHDILSNLVYTGKTYVRKYKKNPDPNGVPKQILRPKSEWIPFRTKQLVSEELFNKVNNALKRNSEFSFRKGKPFQAMLAKLIYCKQCGRKYSFYNHCQRNKIIYYCQGKIKTATDHTCNSSRITAWRIEKPIWDKLKEIIINPDIAKTYIKKAIHKDDNKEKIQKDIIEKKSNIKSLVKQEERLLDLFQTGGIESGIYMNRVCIVKFQKENIAREVSDLERKLLSDSQIKNGLGGLDEIYQGIKNKVDDLDYKTKCKIVSLLVDKIETEGQDEAIVHLVMPNTSVLHTGESAAGNVFR